MATAKRTRTSVVRGPIANSADHRAGGVPSFGMTQPKGTARVMPAELRTQLVVRFKPDVLQHGMQLSSGGDLKALVDGSQPLALMSRLVSSHGLRQVQPIFNVASPVRGLSGTGGIRSAMASTVISDLAVPDSRNVGFATLEFQDEKETKRALQVLLKDDFVQFAETVPLRWLSVRRPDAQLNRQWGLRAIGFFQAGLVSAASVPVAVLDSGVDMSHPLLAGVVSSYEHYGWTSDDYEQHGTHVIGTIAAAVNDAFGVSGVADSPVMAWKVIEDKPTKDGYRFVSFKEYARALAEVETSGAKVLNLSLGGTEHSEAEQILMKRLADADVFIAAAMGNEYEEGNPKEYPAGYRNVYAVAAADETGQRAAFSNTGAHAFISAPGKNILSSVPLAGNSFPCACYDGTSMATPHVAAAAAIVRAKYPKLKATEVARLLAATAQAGIGQTAGKKSHSYGHGLLRLDLALKPASLAILSGKAEPK